jgi:hypothetical protein
VAKFKELGLSFELPQNYDMLIYIENSDLLYNKNSKVKHFFIKNVTKNITLKYEFKKIISNSFVFSFTKKIKIYSIKLF